MTTRHWILPILLLASGCASSPASQTRLSEAPPEIDKRTLVNDEPLASAAPEVVSLTPEMFVDANAVAPTPVETVFQSAPATLAPSYTVTSLTDPSIVQPTAQSVRILPQAAIPQSVPSPGLGLDSAMPNAMASLDKLDQEGGVPDGGYGFVLVDAQNGRILSERNADVAMAPASIAKLLAAVAILETKGLGGSFRTAINADGPISNGVLSGNLHLIGSGDPTLDRTHLDGLARQLQGAGVRSVSGRFYYHSDALPEVAMIDAGQSRGAIYNPGLSGLNLDYNEGSGRSPVSKPALHTALAMQRAAQAAGVTLPEPMRAQGPEQGAQIASHDSAPVSAILIEMFDISRNVTAEALGAAAATELGGMPNSLRDAAQTNAQWVQGQIGSIGGAEWSGFDFANNSGLSTISRATPRQMAALVRYGYQRHGDSFKQLFERQSSGARFGVRAKIGTMSHVRGLGGIMTIDGRDLVFAIMANDTASHVSAKSWMGKARRLEQAVMRDWLHNNWPETQTAALQ